MYYPPATHNIEIRLDLDPDPDSGTRNPQSWSWYGLSIGPRVTLHTSKKFRRNPFMTYAAKCQFTPYLLMVQNAGKWSRIHKRIWIAIKNSR